MCKVYVIRRLIVQNYPYNTNQQYALFSINYFNNNPYMFGASLMLIIRRSNSV